MKSDVIIVIAFGLIFAAIAFLISSGAHGEGTDERAETIISELTI